MRGIETQVRKIRRQIFAEVSRIGFESDDESLIHDIEAIPYKIVTEDGPQYRDSIYRARAIATERVRLAMGMCLRPTNKPVHLTDGIEASNISEKYYEPPLMQVVPSACASCEDNKYEVSDMCKGCLAHPCAEVCPKHAISMVNGQSYIDQEKCVSCGMCMVSCPFGAISDKSQIYQLARSLKEGNEIIAEIAPAFVGQFGSMEPKDVHAALETLGFSEVYEVALGADIGAVSEARHYAEKVATGELPFLLTSCCPSWSMLAKKYFPTMIDNISQELTPMVATARSIKQEHPNAKVVFIGPCAAKKLEASRRSVRSDVDFVITFEELVGMFDAKGIDMGEKENAHSMHDATAAGRGYAVAGGVAGAIEECLKAYYPDVTPKIIHAEGLAECKKTLALAKAGKINGCLIEGMGCPGGCIAGAGTNLPLNKAAAKVKWFKSVSSKQLPPKELAEIELK